MMGADHLRKVAGYDFHDLRRKCDVRTMWGDLDPQWRLLQSQLVARGPGWYSPADLKERLFTNKSEKELIRAMYDQIGKEEQVISPPYTRTPLDASMRGQKKRKQGDARSGA